MAHASVEPTNVPFHILEEITDGFSQERKLGSGAFGEVFKGIHKNGEKVAVKVLRDMPGLDGNEEQFQKEYSNLEKQQHKNIVRLVGYSNEIHLKRVDYDGQKVFAETRRRALCFEYMDNGSLDKYIADESCGHGWPTRYGIIKGICMGLKYLQEESEFPMNHLDLKPENVLLDCNMVPKIADFGLSRLFGGEQTQVTCSSVGTRGYLPPEYIDSGIISKKFDIYSLGVVIIKIMSGPEGYFRSAEMTTDEFTKHVHKKWEKRLYRTSMYALKSIQVNRCIEIALSCVESDRHNRPSIGVIVNNLNETETMFHYPHSLGNDLTSMIHQQGYHQVCPSIAYHRNTVAMIGPWGGNGGKTFYMEGPLRRLKSVKICCGEVIDSIAFSYTDQAGVSRTAGPWGGDGGYSEKIIFDELESIKKVSGTIGKRDGWVVVSSLTLVTNVKSYGPYGYDIGTPFSVPVGDNSSVVGFFGRAGTYVDAIGVYVDTSVPIFS